MNDTPTVSIGLPIHNGESFVGAAIESILAQTYPDFELVISDNASSDGTEAICRRYAARDHRIRYYRQRSNVGAAHNFNLTFHQSTGRYFKWAAHDDLIEPTFLERCVAALEANPDAVLCQSLVKVIDQGETCRAIYDHVAFGTDGPRQSGRFGARLRARKCMDVFGLMRADVLRQTALIADHVGADRTLLVELALRGRFVGVPEPLFLNRDHPARFTRRLATARVQAGWYAPNRSGQRVFRTWTLYAICLRLARRHVAEWPERLRCYGHLVRSLAYHRRWLRLALEPLEAVDPRAAGIEPWLVRRAWSLRLAIRQRGTGRPSAASGID